MAQSYLRQGNLAEAERQAAGALRYAEQHTGENASSGATLAPFWLRSPGSRGRGASAKPAGSASGDDRQLLSARRP
jgi:LuxR family maltose regulon positive regulatory protein